ncbi:MAG: pitrilysin family protein [Acidobacteriaceae bacterium]|nr:pitrilysin family protein [Acidobacteriaceae bacterium]
MSTTMTLPRTRLLAAAAAALAGSLTLNAQTPAPKPHAAPHKNTAPTQKLPALAYEQYTLPNGLTVLTHVDHRLPLVAVDLWYHVGPLNERAGRTGFAHLFEHMMFEGSEHVGEKAHIKDVEAAGATDVNGTTNYDRTNYFETMPANQLELALWLESDRMGFLMEGLNRDLLANQRDVVRNERRQGEGRPYDLGSEELMHLMLPKSHPYYASVIGSHADIEAARIADIRDFHQQFYTPNNASIAIAGDFDPAKLKELLTKYFGPIPKGPDVPKVEVSTPAITAQRRATVTDTVQLPQIQIGWLTPAAFTPESYNLAVAADALGMAKISRLDKALIYDRQLAQSVECDNDQEKLTSMTTCAITARPGVKLEEIEPVLWETVAKLQADGPTEDEVKAAKAKALSSKILGLQRLGGFGGVADTLDRYNQYTGDPGYLPKDVAALDAVTVAGAKAAAARYLGKDQASVVYIVPGKKVVDDVPRSPADTDANVKITNPYDETFETSQAWRKQMPAPGPAVTFHLPEPATFTLANGLKVFVVEDHTLPVLSSSLVIRAGSSFFPAGKPGLPSLTASTLGEATKTLNVAQLASAEELIGTRISTGSTVESAIASSSFLTAHTAQALQLLSEIVQQPAFAESDFDRLKKKTLVGIQQSTDNVFQMAFRAGPRLVFGDTGYGMPSNGTLESVSALTRDDLVNFYNAHYGPSDSALIFTGDLTLADAHHLAEKYFGSWSNPVETVATDAVKPELKPTFVAILDKPGAPQTALATFGLGVPATSPDVPALEIMNYTLGGAFGSRINMNLREQHGYTYGAQSEYINYARGGMFFAGGLIRTDATGDAAKELLGEIKSFPTHPPTDNELTEAKAAQIQSLPGQFETTEATAGAMRSLFIYNRPLNYYVTLPEKYRAVTADDVARVAKTDLDPNHLVIVAAGDRKKIEDELKKQNLGPMEILDTNGKKVADE